MQGFSICYNTCKRYSYKGIQGSHLLSFFMSSGIGCEAAVPTHLCQLPCTMEVIANSRELNILLHIPTGNEKLGKEIPMQKIVQKLKGAALRCE